MCSVNWGWRRLNMRQLRRTCWTRRFVGNLIPKWLNDPNNTLQGINISHLGKRKIIFKMPFLGDMLAPCRVDQCFVSWACWKNQYVLSIPSGKSMTYGLLWLLHDPLPKQDLDDQSIHKTLKFVLPPAKKWPSHNTHLWPTQDMPVCERLP